MGIIAWLVIGLLAGLIGRALVPGRDSMGMFATLVLGLIGSLIGGFLGNLLFDGNWDLEAAGIVGSIVGAVIALLVFCARVMLAVAVDKVRLIIESANIYSRSPSRKRSSWTTKGSNPRWWCRPPTRSTAPSSRLKVS